tara:strand:- start:561 stop:1232 length:672 start_codon:yes stop_codon:yes gene_type:complete
MRIIRKSTEKLLIESFKEEFKKIADRKSRTKKRLSFVLTGGSSPINLYKKLSKLRIDWSNIDFFWGDERYVPKNSVHSNYLLAKKNLLRFIKVRKKQIYSIDTKKTSAKKSAILYASKIKKYFKKNKNRFDIFLLGMGDDGHIASIFPKNLERKSSKITRAVARKDFQRVTVNLKTINSSKFIYLWLNTKKTTKIFSLIKNKKKEQIPVSYLRKNKTTVFSLK